MDKLNQDITTVTNNWTALSNIADQTPELCLIAVRQNGEALEYVKEELQSPELCLLAVKQCGMALQYVKNQTEEICIAAVSQNDDAMQFVIDKTEAVVAAYDANRFDWGGNDTIFNLDDCLKSLKPTRKVIAISRQEYTKVKKRRTAFFKQRERAFRNIESHVFDPNFFDKPCLQLDGSPYGLWVDENGKPVERVIGDTDEGLRFVKVFLDQPFNLKRVAELAEKSGAKSSIMIEVRSYFDEKNMPITVSGMKKDVFGESYARGRLIVFEYEIASNTLKVYQPHTAEMTYNPSRRDLVYANVDGKKLTKQADLTRVFGDTYNT